jgi:DNA-binding transcriptional regulator YiaG
MNRVTCSNCGAEATVSRGSYHFIESGLDNVVLQGIEIIHCDNCENDDPIIPRMNDLMRLLTIAVIGKRYTLCGEEIRFLRKYLLKTAEQLAQMLHVDKTTVSKWENDADKIGDQSDRLLRVYALALGDGLETKLKDMIECFPAIESEQRHIGIEIDPADMSHRYV